MGQNNKKSDLFYMISTTLKKTEDRGTGCFILQQNVANKFLEN